MKKVLVDLNMVTIHAGTLNGDVDFGIKNMIHFLHIVTVILREEF